MKMKRKTNYSPRVPFGSLKGILVLGLLFLGLSAQGQQMNIEVVNDPASETGQVPAQFRLFLTPDGSIPLNTERTVNYQVEVSSTATPTDDYTALTGTATIPMAPLPQEGFIVVDGIIDDNIVEGSETVVVTLLDGDNYSLPPNPVDRTETINISDNDVAVVSMILVPPNYRPEAFEGGANGQYRIELDKPKGEGVPLEVNFSISGSAEAGDYDLTGAVNAAETFVTWPNVQSSARHINVLALDDADSDDETLVMTLTITNNPLFSIGNPNNATVTIIDDDCAAGATAPARNATSSDLCDVASLNLNTLITGGAGSAPAGSALRWSLVASPTLGQLLATPTVSISDTYYGLYWADDNSCASESVAVVVAFNTSPEAGTAVANLTRCNDNTFGTTTIDLDNAITGQDAGGTWAFVDGPINVPFNANNVVNFNNDPLGTYRYRYTVVGQGSCNDDSVIATITVEDCNPCTAGNSPPPRNNNSSNLCDVASLNLNTLITGGAGSAPTGSALRWSLVENPTAANQLLANSTVASSNTYYGLYWDNVNTCASPSTEIIVNLNTSPDAGTATNASRCADNTFGSTTIDLDNTLTGADTGGNWTYISGGNGNPGINGNNEVDFEGDPLGNYVFRYTVTGTTPCGDDFVNVTITVEDCDPCTAGNTAPTLNSGVETNFCDEVTQSLNDYTSTAPPTGTELRWSSDSDLENESAHLNASQIATPLPGTYYGFFWDDVNDCASPALVINLTVNTTPEITATSGDERCGPGQVSLTATVTGNPTINWYNTETGVTIAGTGSSFSPNVAQTRSYWVEATENSCATSPRIEVVATVVPQPSAGTPSDSSACSVAEFAPNGVTTVNLDTQLIGEDEGQWSITTDPSNDLIIGAGNVVDFIGRPDGDYVFTYITTGAMAPCENESSVVTISVSSCDTDVDMDGLLGGYEAAIGTDPNNPDTDEDGISDGNEIGGDKENPRDEDEDGIIDALDSNIADSDSDGIVDQQDPANDNPCIPNRLNGVCDFDSDDLTDSEEEEIGSDPDDPCSPNPDHPNCNPDPIDLEILKVVDNENAIVGDQVVFTVTVNNLSDRKVSNVVIGDMLESGFEYVSHMAEVGSYDLDTGHWTIFELNPMGNTSLQITVTIVDGGIYTNTATLLESFPEDITEPNNEAIAEILIDRPEGIDLVLEKTALSENPLINEMVVFTIKVTNQSANGNTINNIQVEDIIPSGVDSPFVYVSHEAPGTEYNVATGVWTIESLGISQIAELMITVNVPVEGVFTNTARILRSSPADSNPDNNEMTVTVNVSLPTPADVGFLFNQFSPNADGTNDFLEINKVDPETNQEMNISYNVQIFNRYGNLVFEGNNMTEAEVWDGSWKGKESPDGTYFYIMNVDVGDGNGSQTKKGWIQLIR